MTASQFIDIQCLKPDTILLTLLIIKEAITHLSSDRPTAYSDSIKLVGKFHSLETFLSLNALMLLLFGLIRAINGCVSFCSFFLIHI